MPKPSPARPPPLIRYRPEGSAAGPVATEYRVGLCAWQDKSMLEEGSFYPIKSMNAEERLWWYSRFFENPFLRALQVYGTPTTRKPQLAISPRMYG